jgi:DNA-binding MarR family transcriptional regulator
MSPRGALDASPAPTPAPVDGISAAHAEPAIVAASPVPDGVPASPVPDGVPASPVPHGVPEGVAEAVPEGVDPLSQRVFAAFTRALRAHGQLMVRMLADKGMHPGQAFCLRTLARHDGMSQRDLAATLHVSRPTVTAMLQRMERSGMVLRTTDEGDQRITRVHLTEEGRRLERSLTKVLLTYSARVLDSIPSDDRLELERLLGRLADNTAAALADRPGESRGDDCGPDEMR